MLFSKGEILFSGIIDMRSPFCSYLNSENNYTLPTCTYPGFACNYVRNGEFELNNTIPTYISQINYSCGWISGNGGSPDYFSSQSQLPPLSPIWIPDNNYGSQPAKSGNFYAGINVYWPGWSPGDFREYLTNNLYIPLPAGQYYAEYYAALSEGSFYAIKNLGMYFSQNDPHAVIWGALPVNPQIESSTVISDCNQWTRISGCLTVSANDNFQYITIGNFRNDGSTVSSNSTCYQATYNNPQDAYYYIEDVSVIKLPEITNHSVTFNCTNPLTIGPTICNGSSLYNSINYSWSPSTNLSNPNIANPTVIWNNPGSTPVTIHYTLTMTINGCTATDFVDVTFQPGGFNPSISASSPSAFCNGGNITLTASPTTSVTYLWSNNLGTNSWATVNSAGTYSVTVSNGNCVSEAQITILPPVSPAISINTPTAICLGQTLFISANCTTCNSYNWIPNLGNGSGYFVSPSATTSYTVTGTDATTGCTATAQATLNVIDNHTPKMIIEGPESNCAAAGTGSKRYSITNWIQQMASLYSWSFFDVNGNSLVNSQISWPNGLNGNMADVTWPTQDFGGYIIITFGLPGCLQTVRFDVQNCCPANSGITYYDKNTVDDITPVNPAPIVSWGGERVFNGAFIVDRNLTIRNSTLGFAPGARILVKQGSYLRLENCILQPGSECCTMFKGIEVEAGARIELIDNCEIKQAEFGVKLNGNCSYTITDAKFNSNYIGIYSRSNSINGRLENCEFFTGNFYCNGLNPAFVDKYLGQQTNPDTWTYAGIFVESVPTSFTIGNVLNTPNGNIYFHDVANGILADKANIIVRNCRFQDMRVGPSYTSPSPVNRNSCAINLYRGSVDIIGLTGQCPGSYYTFDNCKFAISLNGGSGKIHDCGSNVNVNTGIFLYNSRSIDIFNNCIRAQLKGINVNNSASASRIHIYDNEIRMSGMPFLTGAGCIGFNEPPANLNHQHRVVNNQLYINNALYGINAINLFNGLIQHNLVQLTNSFFSRVGIKLMNGKNNHIDCNYVYAPQIPMVNTEGITLSMSQQNVVSCNYVNNETVGIRFNGACNNSTLQGNEINYYNTGLGLYYISNGNAPVIGLQPPVAGMNYGNIWHQTVHGAPWGGYIGNVTQFDAQNNQFHFDQNVSLPAGYSNIPQTTNVPATYFWFVANNDADFQCSQTDCIPITPPDVSFIQEDITIAESDDTTSVFPGHSYCSDRFLFARLLEDPSLITGDPLLEAFYTVNLYGNVGAYSQVEADMQDAVRREAVYEFTYSANEGLIRSKQDSIQIMDNLLNADPQNANLYGPIKENLYASIEVLTLSNEALLNMMNQIQEYKIQNVRDANGVLSYESQYEENEQTINSIYLSTIAQEIYTFSPDQVLALEEIMEQCPFTGGPAVYTAWAFYSLIDPSIVRDDDNLCILAGISPRIAKPQNTSEIINIYPNPATDNLLVSYFADEKVEANLYIYNNLGVMVLQKKLDIYQHEVNVDVSELSSGLYSCIIAYDSANKLYKQISIIK